MITISQMSLVLVVAAAVFGPRAHGAIQSYGGNAYIDINNPVVQTTYGPIRGARYQLSQPLSNRNPNLNVVQFIGVPYAQAPTGVNRFRVRQLSANPDTQSDF